MHYARGGCQTRRFTTLSRVKTTNPTKTQRSCLPGQCQTRHPKQVSSECDDGIRASIRGSFLDNKGTVSQL